jgi:hypothetical protein
MLASDNADEIWARIDSSTSTTSFLLDGLESAVALTAARAINGNYSYGPYGSSTNTGSNTTSIQYTGYLTGLGKAGATAIITERRYRHF